MPLFAKDSLINLRSFAKKSGSDLSHTTLHRQNVVFSSRATSIIDLARDELCNTKKLRKRLPIDDLESQLLAKRKKLSEAAKPQKSVSFDMSKNQIHNHDLFLEDGARTWLSPVESNWIKESIILTVAAFRAGCLDTSQDSMRGLEYRASNSITEEKILKNNHFRLLLLGQQQFFQELEGKANELMLSKLSQILSSNDVKEAIAFAAADEKEIHAVDVRTAEKASNAMHDSAMTPAGARIPMLQLDR